MSNIDKLRQLRERLFFTAQDISGLLGIRLASARVACVRYVQQGIFIRIKRDFYILEERWRYCSRKDFFTIANFLQVPSYISCITALSFYEITTQVQRSFFESVSVKRTFSCSARDAVFMFSKISRKYYFGFIKENGFFIATPEKAFVDTAYLCSFGKYKVDFDAMDTTKLDMTKVDDILKKFPEQTRFLVRKLCRT